MDLITCNDCEQQWLNLCPICKETKGEYVLSAEELRRQSIGKNKYNDDLRSAIKQRKKQSKNSKSWINKLTIYNSNKNTDF